MPVVKAYAWISRLNKIDVEMKAQSTCFLTRKPPLRFPSTIRTIPSLDTASAKLTEYAGPQNL
ncbi:MAG: hypothetical protein ABSF82_04815 [Candidatus Bathyarchaeia archaeon]